MQQITSFAAGESSELSGQLYHAHRQAIYRRTESMASGREINCFQCDVCGETLESWNTAWVPNYRLVAGPVRPPEDSHKH